MFLFEINYAEELRGRFAQTTNRKHFNLLFSTSDNHTLRKDDSDVTAALHLDPLASSISTTQHPQLN